MMALQQQLEATRLRLLSAITGLSERELNWKPDDATWSIAQVVQHIAAVEGSSSHLIALGLSGEPNFVPADLPLEQTISDRSRKVNAPARLHPPAEPKTLEQLTEILHTNRDKLMAELTNIEDITLLDKTTPGVPHPVFGHMSTAQWIQAVPLHEARHIEQILQLKDRLRQSAQ